MTNIEIARLLRQVAAAYTVQNEQKYRFQILAYQKAADEIESSTTEIEDLVIDNSLNIPGVGQSLKSHLEELIKTGKVKHFERIMSKVPPAMFPLLEVTSFGPKRAYKLVNHFHLTNPETIIEDLEKLAKQGKIAEIEGFGEKSQSDIIRALNEFKEGKGKTVRMTLSYASEIAGQVVRYLKSSKYVLKAFPLGSLRRMAPAIGDIDIAIATDHPENVIKHFIKYPNLLRIIEKGPTTASILLSNGKQVDLMTQPPDCFGSLLQHFTGSKHHNVHLREYALKKDLSLSEYGIKRKTKDGEKTKCYDTEEKFYKALGLQWIPPEMREDTGEIELAIDHQLPKLVELPDIKGDLHIHSDYPLEPSHDLGRNNMQDMINKAKELGYEYLGFSEHNPNVSRHTKEQVYSIMSRRNVKIEQLKESNKDIRLIKLLEIDILSNNSLALDDKSFELLDAAIVSVHSSFSISKKEMTKRIIQGLSHPKAKIFAHPTGRLLNERPGYEVDFEVLFEFCIKHNKALEINGWPNRLDLPDSLIRKAIEAGVKMVIDTDSHAVEQMNMMKFGVAQARRGWAGKRDILNSLEYNSFMEWLLL